MGNCFVCSSNRWKQHNSKPDYDVCIECGNIVKRDLDDPTVDIFSIYGNECTDLMKTLLANDLGHYRAFFRDINCKEFVDKNFSVIYSLGGGMPKLESFLKHEKIEITDACADNYLNYQRDFSSIYEYRKDITYNKA
jgi:hypothetical protein